MEKNHEFFMKEALKDAEKAFATDEVPVGAVVVVEAIEGVKLIVSGKVEEK